MRKDQLVDYVEVMDTAIELKGSFEDYCVPLVELQIPITLQVVFTAIEVTSTGEAMVSVALNGSLTKLDARTQSIVCARAVELVREHFGLDFEPHVQLHPGAVVVLRPKEEEESNG